jgi:hypothetical protein
MSREGLCLDATVFVNPMFVTIAGIGENDSQWAVDPGGLVTGQGTFYLGVVANFEVAEATWTLMLSTGKTTLTGSVATTSKYLMNLDVHLDKTSVRQTACAAPTGGDAHGDPGVWSAISGLGAPRGRTGGAYWIGTDLLVVGGSDGVERGGDQPVSHTGGLYDPVLDHWKPIAEAPVQADLFGAWIGNAFLATAGAGLMRYDVATDSWSNVQPSGPPTCTLGGTPASSGAPVFFSGPSGCGNVFDPSTNSWITVQPTGLVDSAPPIWTGSVFVFWGGGQVRNNQGLIYDPATHSTKMMATAGAPTARTDHTEVWTGKEVIVWGGSEAPVAGVNDTMATGGRYDPLLDQWTPMAQGGGPVNNVGHTSIWTGSEMIVWGGSEATTSAGGYKYDPATDRWAQLSDQGAPVPRTNHTAVWTGSAMLIWGGMRGAAPAEYLLSGGIYHPDDGGSSGGGGAGGTASGGAGGHGGAGAIDASVRAGPSQFRAMR